MLLSHIPRALVRYRAPRNVTKMALQRRNCASAVPKSNLVKLEPEPVYPVLNFSFWDSPATWTPHPGIVAESNVVKDTIIAQEVVPEVQHEETEVWEAVKRTYQPHWKRRKSKHGFMHRNSTVAGRKVIRRRAAAGRRISV